MLTAIDVSGVVHGDVSGFRYGLISISLPQLFPFENGCVMSSLVSSVDGIPN